MNIGKITLAAGVLTSTGLVGCAGNSKATTGLDLCPDNNYAACQMNYDSKQMIENAKGAAAYDSLEATLQKPYPGAEITPQASIKLRDMAVRAEYAAKMQNMQETFKEDSAFQAGIIKELNAQLAAQKASDSLKSQMAKDSVYYFCSTELENSNASCSKKLSSADSVAIAKQKASLDSATNAWKKTLANTNRAWKRKLANLSGTDSLKLTIVKLAAAKRQAADSAKIAADSINIKYLGNVVKRLVLAK